MQRGKKMMRNTGSILMALGAVLITSALLLFVHNHRVADAAGAAAEAVLSQIQLLATEKTHEADVVISDEEKEHNATEETAVLGVNQSEEGMPVVSIGAYGYIGYLSLPALELELPVMSEWDYTRLEIAPCRHFGSTVTGDLIIAGHNFDRHFGRLGNLAYGDLMTFTDMEGKTTPYYVSEIVTLQPTQMDELQSGDWDVTLYTCTYGGKSRITVRFTKMTMEDISYYGFSSE